MEFNKELNEKAKVAQENNVEDNHGETLSDSDLDNVSGGYRYLRVPKPYPKGNSTGPRIPGSDSK